MVLSVSNIYLQKMELNLSLAISSSSSSASSCSPQFVPPLKKRKHSVDDEYDHNDHTMPLLVWDGFCCNKNQLINEEHDQDLDCDSDDEVQSNYVYVNQSNDGGVIGWLPMKSCMKKVCHPKIEKEDDGTVGWPPLKLCRKKFCQLKMGTGDGGGNDNQGRGGRSKSTYYKVHMEGIKIARKVDLNLHQSYQTLVPTLANMFGKCYEDVKLTYQNKEGDWLLARDVPWGSFINTVHRLKLLRKAQ